MQYTMQDKVLDAYIEQKPWDDEARRINPEITFQDLYDALETDEFYNVLGVEDSLIRENIFVMLSEILGVDYDDIYNRWLHLDESHEKKSSSMALVENLVRLLEDSTVKTIKLTLENEEENGHKCFKAEFDGKVEEFCQEPKQDFEAAFGQILDDHIAPALGADRAELDDWAFAEDGVNGEATVTFYNYGE